MVHDERKTGQDVIAAEVAGIWCRVLGRKTVPYDATFPDLGGDSLLLIAILTAIDEELGTYLDADDILDDLTVNGITAAIIKVRGQTRP